VRAVSPGRSDGIASGQAAAPLPGVDAGRAGAVGSAAGAETRRTRPRAADAGRLGGTPRAADAGRPGGTPRDAVEPGTATPREPATDAGDTLARLRDAKRRARER